MTLHMLHHIPFHGLASENPNKHLTNFREVCDTIKYNGVTDEALRLRFFPLVDKPTIGLHHFVE